MRKRTQKAVDDISPQVQSEMVRPYKAESYGMHEYYQVPPPGIDWEPPVFDPIPLPTLQVAIPVFSVLSGSYSSAQTVYIVCLTAGATIYYTLDGTEPTQNKTKYVSGLIISVNTTLKAKAFKDGMDASNIATGVYTISAWTAYFNNTKWQIWSLGGYGAWSGSVWVGEFDAFDLGYYLHIEVIGSWSVGYRPTKIRPTFSVAGLNKAPGFVVVDSGWGTLAGSIPCLSGQELSFSFGVNDIYYIQCTHTAPFNVTNIEFQV